MIERLNLADHVGERISATDSLVDGDMQIESLSRVASPCKDEA